MFGIIKFTLGGAVASPFVCLPEMNKLNRKEKDLNLQNNLKVIW